MFSKIVVAVLALSAVNYAEGGSWPKKAEQSMFDNCFKLLTSKGIADNPAKREVCSCLVDRITSTLPFENMQTLGPQDVRAVDMFVTGSLKKCLTITIEKMGKGWVDGKKSLETEGEAERTFPPKPGR